MVAWNTFTDYYCYFSSSVTEQIHDWLPDQKKTALNNSLMEYWVKKDVFWAGDNFLLYLGDTEEEMGEDPGKSKRLNVGKGMKKVSTNVLWRHVFLCQFCGSATLKYIWKSPGVLLKEGDMWYIEFLAKDSCANLWLQNFSCFFSLLR